MTIGKPMKTFIGVLTAFAVLFPFIIAPAFVMFFMLGSGFPSFDPNAVPDFDAVEKNIFPMMAIFYPAMMCFSLIQLGLQIFYIVHEIKNKALTDTYRILFAIGTFFMPYIAMPIYFFAYFWKDNPQETKPAEA